MISPWDFCINPHNDKYNFDTKMIFHSELDVPNFENLEAWSKQFNFHHHHRAKMSVRKLSSCSQNPELP